MALAGWSTRRAAGLAVALAALGSVPVLAQSPGAPIAVVAAENFYGEVAARIGGDTVAVTSILSNPDQDPHLFEVTPSTARRIATARLVIYNGAGYDPWMETLLAASPNAERRAVVAAALLHRNAGANPHLWYDPATMPALAQAVAETLAQIDPDHRAAYRQRLTAFLAALEPLDEEIRTLRRNYAGTVVTATEPIFGDMAIALGFTMRNPGFQLAVMNDTEPSAGDIARFESDLDHHIVRLLFFNTQTTSPMIAGLLDRARAAHIPIIGVSETEPPGKTYPQWMMDQLRTIEQALAGAAP